MDLTHDQELDPLSASDNTDGEPAASGARPKVKPQSSWRLAGFAAGVLTLTGFVGGVAVSRRRPAQAERHASTADSKVELAEVFLPPTLSSQLQDLPVKFMPYGEVRASQLSESMQAELTKAVGWPPAALRNSGANCWIACGKVAGDCKWCGVGNACCKDGAKNDPLECKGAYFPTSEHYTCVTPKAPVAVKHTGQDCWEGCNKKSGFCNWCGNGNACCRKGFESVDARECSGAAGFTVKDRHTCVATSGSCPLGKVSDGHGACVKPEKPEMMTFYMYRATNEQNYPINEGVNMASLSGALWYLHNEVVISCPRKFKITRLRRFKVTMRASHQLYSSLKNNFDLFVAFDRAKCTVPNCKEVHWDKYGFTVGCIKNDKNVANYPDPVWYSLPGTCPSMDYNSKTSECKKNEPGGMCPFPNGAGDCTWWAEEAGEISLNELEGILDYQTFCASRNVEYDPQTDKGLGLSFWNGKQDPAKGQERMTLVKDMFAKKYPNLPRDLGEPECDGWR